GGFVAANDDTGAPGRGGSGRYGERVGRGVDVEEEGTHPRRVVDGGAVDHSAVDEHHRARGATELTGAVGGEGGHIARGDGARPDVVELIENGAAVRAGQRGERALFGPRVLQIDPEGEHRVVRVQPGLDVLVPAHGVAAFGPLEVELRAVKADVRPEQIG